MRTLVGKFKCQMQSFAGQKKTHEPSGKIEISLAYD